MPMTGVIRHALFALPLGAVHAQTENKDLLLRSSYNLTFGWKTVQKKKSILVLPGTA